MFVEQIADLQDLNPAFLGALYKVQLIVMSGISKWYARHKIIVRGSLRVPFIYVRGKVGFWYALQGI